MRKSLQKKQLQSLQMLFCPIGPFSEYYQRFDNSFENLDNYNAFLGKIRKTTDGEYLCHYKDITLLLTGDLSKVEVIHKTFVALVIKNKVTDKGKYRVAEIETRHPLISEIYPKTAINIIEKSLLIFWLTCLFDVKFTISTQKYVRESYIVGYETALRKKLIRS